MAAANRAHISLSLWDADRARKVEPRDRTVPVTFTTSHKTSYPARLRGVIFKRVGDERPYPDHGLKPKDWSALPPRQVRLDELVTTKGTLDLAALLDEDSTFYGDLFAHVVEWKGEMFLEDGLHRALRAALQQRSVLHARVLVVD
ncbi:hypothetical protein GCM10009743_46780 [Kribbella swartbergensis]